MLLLGGLRLRFRGLDGLFEALGRQSQLAAGAVVAGLVEPGLGVGDLNAAFGAGHGDGLVCHHGPPCGWSAINGWDIGIRRLTPA